MAGPVPPPSDAGLSHVVNAKISVVSTKARRAARRDLLSPISCLSLTQGLSAPRFALRSRRRKGPHAIALPSYGGGKGKGVTHRVMPPPSRSVDFRHLGKPLTPPLNGAYLFRSALVSIYRHTNLLLDLYLSSRYGFLVARQRNYRHVSPLRWFEIPSLGGWAGASYRRPRIASSAGNPTPS